MMPRGTRPAPNLSVAFGAHGCRKSSSCRGVRQFEPLLVLGGGSRPLFLHESKRRGKMRNKTRRPAHHMQMLPMTSLAGPHPVAQRAVLSCQQWIVIRAGPFAYPILPCLPFRRPSCEAASTRQVGDLSLPRPLVQVIKSSGRRLSHKPMMLAASLCYLLTWALVILRGPTNALVNRQKTHRAIGQRLFRLAIVTSCQQ